MEEEEEGEEEEEEKEQLEEDEARAGWEMYMEKWQRWGTTV